MKIYSVILMALACILTGCSKGHDAETTVNPDLIAVIGNRQLTRTEVYAAIPAGVSEDDSISLARAYIRRWIDNELVYQVAAPEINMDEIDQLVEEYRRELITGRYRHLMATRGDTDDFSEDSLTAYYESHKADFRLERPLVKGIYLKLEDGAPNLNILKRLYKSHRPVDMDRLENEAASAAIHYDDFRDRWVDWEQIENLIPMEFPTGTTSPLRGHPFECSVGGFTYLLQVDSTLQSGATMPYEAARPIIRERLLTSRRRMLDAVMRNDLYDRATHNNTLVFPNGDPGVR